jgi:hypothetical protein
MQVTPVITQANGILSIRLQATFVGDPTDASDKALIAAYGDPQISLVGNGTFANVPVQVLAPRQFSALSFHAVSITWG